MAGMFKIGISRNTKCDILVGFPKSGQIYIYIYIYICDQAWENKTFLHKIHLYVLTYALNIYELTTPISLQAPFAYEIKRMHNYDKTHIS